MKKQQRRDSIDRSQRSTTSSHASRWSAWCWIFWLASSEQGFLLLGRCCKETRRNACSWNPIGCDFESENDTWFIVIHMMLPSSCFIMFCLNSVNFLTKCRLFHYVSLCFIPCLIVGLFRDLSGCWIWPLGLSRHSFAAEFLPLLLSTERLLDLGCSEDIFDCHSMGSSAVMHKQTECVDSIDKVQLIEL